MINLPFAIGNAQYQIRGVTLDSDGEKVAEKILVDWFDNIIVDGGLNSLSALVTPCEYCCVGSGNTPPLATDTQLVSFLSQTGTKPYSTVFTNNFTVSPFYSEGLIVYRFPAIPTARNISEVGLQSSNAAFGANGNLFSRALVKDSGGAPITIAIPANEPFEVAYKYRIYPPNGGADQTGTITWVVDGTPTVFNYTLRTVGMGYVNKIWKFDLGAGSCFRPASNFQYPEFGFIKSGGVLDTTASSDILAGLVPGQFAPWSSASFLPYVANNFYLDCTFLLDFSYGNGINFNVMCLMFGQGTSETRLAFEIKIDGTISKTNSKQLRQKVRFSWGRYP